MLHVRIVLRLRVQHAERDDDQRRAGNQPENAGECAGDAAKAHADGDRQVDHVAARQELAQAEQIGEFVGGEPFALVDDGAPRERQRAAERHQAERQETGEQLGEADAAGRRAGRRGDGRRSGLHGAPHQTVKRGYRRSGCRQNDFIGAPL
ncbi:hypothetical protein BURCENBC7_AP4590 [Burkholderia cenocepacia BC7]|nr:hypothetical protein BURCENK562V_C0659 [Burkholderia cenocepacia K56-2Valvano]ERI27907.1 hypothetical protein BURCENBC7_AP4590 [Burkholderia cenocepacia BC7]